MVFFCLKYLKALPWIQTWWFAAGLAPVQPSACQDWQYQPPPHVTPMTAACLMLSWKTLQEHAEQGNYTAWPWLIYAQGFSRKHEAMHKSEPWWGCVHGKSLKLYFHPTLSAVGLSTSSEKMLINDSALGTPTDVKENMYPLKKIW